MTRFAALIILFGSILPQVLYVGHWPVPSVTNAAAEIVEHTHDKGAPVDTHDEGGTEHDLHCHTGPSKCSGAQAMTGAIWVGEDSGLLGLDATPRAQSSDVTTLNVEGPFTRVLRPPQPIA
jgi:hypothetical protein